MRKVLFRNRRFQIFLLPVNRNDPPACPVVIQLNAIDAAHEGLRIGRIVLRIIRTEGVSDPPKLLRSPRDFPFVKRNVPEIFLDAADVAFHLERLRWLSVWHPNAGLPAGGNYPRARSKQRSQSIPIPPL